MKAARKNKSMKKYSIGIDLGTTNCVVAYARLDAESPDLQLLRIPQCTGPSETESQLGLASFLYVPTEQEVGSGAMGVEGVSSNTVNGAYARVLSAERPERTISAAKSWLCHGGVDRHSPILPWNADDEVPKFSPVTASKLLLQQLVNAWSVTHPEDPIDQQLVTLTVPASFDMAARELTREAALAAGLPEDFIQLEEPQAAVYHWLEKNGDDWREHVSEGDVVLVCDVGGGTTDLTLVRAEQEDGDLVLRRLAVGNHLLVGGDNMDLALAHYVGQKFRENGVKLNPWQSVALWHSCRRAKESLLSEGGRETETISVLGRGSKLIGGTVKVEVSRQEVQQLLVDGFLPICAPDAQPVRGTETGFQELGLPFETDSAITHHIAAFLRTHYENTGQQMHLLLNGGVFKSPALQSRVAEAISRLLDGQRAVESLHGGIDDLDHAVARGAAYYGWTKETGGIRIRGGTARSYYVGIETAGLAVPGMPRPLQAVCVVPFGMEEGTEIDVPGREVGLVVGREAKFRFFSATDRKEDAPGTTLRDWDEDELQETTSMEVKLDVDEPPDEGFVPVHFSSKVSELGVLELWCKSKRDQQKWKLEFTVREMSGADA